MVPVRRGEADGECSAAAVRSGARRRHSEAERKRRGRINGHLDTLRGLLPSASRMDKAALLGEVVQYVRELRGEVGGAVVPGESDEVGVEEDEDDGCSWNGEERTRSVRAWVCCADRPELMSELGRAVRLVGGRAVRAEIATMGGRTRSVLELDVAQAAAGGGDDGGASPPTLQAALRAVLVSPEELLAVESYKRRRCSASAFRQGVAM